MLYMAYQDPISSYSKAPRGLSVLPQVTRIFTGTTISPSPLLRQCPNRCAFRAGRNLPDKEFRYLRTVIVTAAIDRGFGSMLRVAPNMPPSPSGIGQASAPVRRLSASQRPVVLVISRLGPFAAAPQCSKRRDLITLPGTPFPEVTELFCRVP